MASHKGYKRKSEIVNNAVALAETFEQYLSKQSLFEYNSNTKKAFPDFNIYYLNSNNIYNLSKSLGTINLKPHQETALYYMMGLEQQIYTVSYTNTKKIKQTNPVDGTVLEKDVNEDNESIHYTNLGLLCDKVGSGKSYVILALIKEKKSLESIQLINRESNIGSSIINFGESIKKLNTNILLVPHGLVAQWEDCCKKTNVKYYTINKAQDIFNLGENCLFAKHKAENSKKTNSQPKSKDKSSIIDVDEINVTPIDSGTTKKKVSIIRKKKNNTEENNIDVIETNEKINTVESDDTNKKLLEEKLKLQENIDSLESQLKVLQEERNEYNKKSHELENTAKQIAKKYGKEISDYNFKTYSIYTIRCWFKSLIVDKVEYQNVYEIINSLDETYNKIQSYDHKITTLLQSIKQENKNINGKLTDQDINDINRNFENPHFTRFLKYFGKLNKKLVESYDIIIVSENFYNLFSLYINRDNYTVNRVIVDECNSIKGSNMIQIKTVFTWLVSSSVNSLINKGGWSFRNEVNSTGRQSKIRYKCVNSTGFILELIKQLYDNIYENYKLFLINDPEYIEQSMTLPESINIILSCKDNQSIRILNGLVSFDIMKMLNAGNITGIISKLECQSATETDIVTIITQKYEDDLKLKEYSLQMAIGKPNYDPENETEGTKNIRIAINDLKEKIANIKSRVMDNEECSICYDTFSNPCLTSCCSQKYCFPCITLALNSNGLCPNCNQSQNPKNLVMIGKIVNTTEDEKTLNISDIIKNPEKSFSERLELLKNDSENCSKYENMSRIFSLISTEEKQKILIFTEYESTLNEKMSGILTNAGLKYGRLKGSSDTIKKVIDSYRNGDVNVLMINSVFFGSGTNLENTTDIIIIHKMFSDIEMQVIGRAQRFGRVGNLRIWKLYYQNEI